MPATDQAPEGGTDAGIWNYHSPVPVPIGDFFHQLHHRSFECNYGNSEVPLDKMSGHFHDGTQASTKKVRERIRRDRKVRARDPWEMLRESR